MADYSEKIKELEDQIKKTKYNKKTQHAIGLYKAKLAKLKEAEFKRSSGGKKGEGYSVRKSGDATVILVGFPSVGKSTLLNILTGAASPVASYEFTTLDVIPGTLNYESAQIQVLDVPGVVHGAAMGRGRGKEVLAVMRSADLAIVLIDSLRPEHHQALLKEIYDSGLRLNQEPPDVKIKKTARGGVRVGTTVRLTRTDKRTIQDVLREFKINNADVVVRTNITIDQLIDVVEKNKVYIPAITVLNKIDLIGEKRIAELKKKIKPDLCISAQQNIGVEEIKDLMFKKLKFIRIYCKEVGKKADLDVPLILKEGSTIKTMCEKLHKDFVSKFKFSRLWGPSAKFDGQKFMLGHKLKDKDIVELHIR